MARPETKRSRGRPKLAAEIAAAIEAEIIQRGWPVGEILGAESALLERHRASRAVVREAVRILEHRGVARMRPGPGGGLLVTAPDGTAVASATDAFLEYTRATPQHIFETRRALELSAIELAVQRLDEDGIARLRARIDYEARVRAQADGSSPGLLDAAMRGDEFHTLIAELSGNSATELLVRALSQATWSRYLRQMKSQRIPAAPSGRVHDHAEITEAIVAGDAALARHRMRRHLEELEKLLDLPAD